MLILHTSDWHLGRTLHGEDLSASAEAFLDWLIGLVEERGVDAVVVSGDVYDRAVPPVDSVRRLRRALVALCARAPVVLTSGNHDGPVRLGAFAGLLDARLTVVTDPLSVGTAIELGGEDRGALVYAIPYLEPDLVRQQLSDLPGGEDGEPPPLPRSHEAVLAAALRRVGADLRRRRADGDERPALCMAHAFITGALPSDSERDIEVGGVASVSASLFDSLGLDRGFEGHGLDYVAAGHLHRPQDVAGSSVPIRYSGSPIAYSFSEAGADKSVTLVSTGPTSVLSVEEAPIPVLREVRVLEGTMDALLSDPDPGARRSYCSVTVTDAARPAQMVPRIREAYPHALVVQHRSPAEVSHRPGRGAVASRSPREVCEEFFEAVGGRALDDEERGVARSVWERMRGEERS